MRKLCLIFLLALCFSTSSSAKLEALSVLTKYCGKTELIKAGKGAIHKVVSEFNGKNMHGFIIELDIAKVTKAQLTKNLLDMGCYTRNSKAEEVLERITRPTKTYAQNSRNALPHDDDVLMPEDMLADDSFVSSLLNTEIH